MLVKSKKIRRIKVDEFVKSQKTPSSVIHAPKRVRDKLQQESSYINGFQRCWTSVCIEVTTFYGFIKILYFTSSIDSYERRKNIRKFGGWLVTGR